MNTPRCRCGRPSPDAFLCQDCTEELTIDLAALGQFLPELTTLLTRQARANRGSRPAEPPPMPSPPSTRVLSPSERIGLVANPLPFDEAASVVLLDARNKLATWAIHLCESRDLDPEVIWAAA